MNPLSIYIHIPFCAEKCFYCDFLSFSNKQIFFDDYLKALLTEIKNFEDKNEYIVKSIFFGGGTPSILPIGYIGKIMECIFKFFKVSNDCETTIEVNPGVVSLDLIKHFKKSKINRVSIGLQAWQNNILKKLGRVHTKEQFVKNFYNFRQMGFNNINVDLMFSLPDQSICDWVDTLYNICKLSPEHISCYSLIIEENTPFKTWLDQGKIKQNDENKDRLMYNIVKQILVDFDYFQYEISNFSKKNKECFHNKVYWTLKEYVGFGLGASSFLNNKRIKNTENFNDYINLKNTLTIDELKPKDCYAEFMFLGLRMTKGVLKKEFEKMFKKDIYEVYGRQLEYLKQLKLIEDNKDYIFLTKKGVDVSNTVFIEFI